VENTVLTENMAEMCGGNIRYKVITSITCLSDIESISNNPVFPITRKLFIPIEQNRQSSLACLPFRDKLKSVCLILATVERQKMSMVIVKYLMYEMILDSLAERVKMEVWVPV